MINFPFPPAFEVRMKERLKDEWNSFEAAHLTSSPISIRFNPKKSLHHPATLSMPFARKIPWTSLGSYLSERPRFTLDPAIHAGAYYVQEASSMFLEQAIIQTVDLGTSLNVLDLCAAPGGKSTLLSSLISDHSLLVSNEVIRSRANILTENIIKWGSNNVVVTNNDPAEFRELINFFDVVVVDAPCSGEGLFRKEPDAMNEWSVENVSLCAARQKRILLDVWPSLKENGILIYCTCTYNELENEENLLWLEQEHDVEFIELNISEYAAIEKISKGSCIGYRFYPHKIDGEGFFLSVMKKKASADMKQNRFKSNKRLFESTSKKTLAQITEWVLSPEKKSFIQRGDLIQFFSKNKFDDIQFLTKQLRIVYAGTYMATLKHEKLIPEHACALSIEINSQKFFTIELPYEDALKYLRKENLNINVAHKGFALVTYEGLPLGWINVLPNRINNLYPPEWRIRMT